MVVIVGIQTAAVVGFAYALVVGADAACAGEENLVVVAVVVAGREEQTGHPLVADAVIGHGVA